MRLRVFVRRATGRRPARVTDPGGTVWQRGVLQVIDQDLQFPGMFARAEFSVDADYCYPCRVVSSVFQAPQTTQQYLNALDGANVTHDSTHGLNCRTPAL